MNKRIILSGGMLVFMAAIVAGGTGAFFSDTETSENNVFTAGSVTVGIEGITHTYNGADANNAPIYNDNGFNFILEDLKPLDEGNIDYELVNGANEAHICALVTETENNDNGINDPESDAGDTTDGVGNGELGDFLNFKFGTQTGSLSAIAGQWQTVGTAAANASAGSGFEYCFGEFDGTGACVLGSGNDNLAQTDSLTADVQFYAVQTRNNEDFSCSDLGVDGELRPAVGAFEFAYAAPEPASCDLVVDEAGNGDHLTLAAAEAVASDGDVICVDTGTYTENVTVDVENVTILGLNDPMSASKATLDGQLTIDVDGVTVSGLEITNPDAGYGVLIQGVNNTEISDNSIVNVGTALPSGSAQAIYYDGAAVAASGLTIDGNTIVGVGSPTKGAAGGSKGIFIGDSTSPMALAGVVITDNVISDIKTSNATFSNGGRGAYGILINYGVNSTGNVVGSVVMNNTISDLEGWWSHAIGLETNTPNASVTKNDISDVVDGQGGVDAIGVFFEGNAGGSTTVVNENNFAADIGAFAVAIHPANPAITVDAEDNWWGDVTPADEKASAGSSIDSDPFEASAFPTN